MKIATYVQLSLMMFLQWFIMGAWIVMVQNYMKDLEMDAHVHWAFATVPLSAIVAPYFVGLIADRYFATERILAVLHILGGVFIFSARWCAESSGQPVLLLVLALLFHSLCYAPTIGLTCSLSFHHMTNQERQFPVVRVFGTIGWIAAGILVSRILKADGTGTPLQVAGVAGVLMGLFCLTLPHTPPVRKGEAVSFKEVIDLGAVRSLFDFPFTVFLVSAFLICMPLAAYYAYTPVFLGDLGIAHAGFQMSFGQMSEIFFMLIIPLLFAHLGVKRMIVIAMLAWTARYLLFAFAAVDGIYWMMLIGILLHGICYDFFFVVGQIYVDKKADVANRAQAQSLFVFMTSGLGMFIGTHVSGPLYNAVVQPATDKAGAWHDFWIYPAVVAAAVTIAFAILFRDRSGSEKS